MDTDTNKIVDLAQSQANSRRNFLKVALAAGAGAALASKALNVIPAHAATDDLPTIINVALVAEQLAVTFQTNALLNAATIGLKPDEVTTIQAVLATEALHIRYLQAYGAAPAYGTQQFTQFSFPAGTFSSRKGYANTAIFLETAFVTAYMAAVRDFAADARADLAGLAYQIGAVEAEHRALSRSVGGYAPYADLAFELNLIPNVATAATVLGSGSPVGSFLAPASGNTYTFTDFVGNSLVTNAINAYARLLTAQTPDGSRIYS